MRYKNTFLIFTLGLLFLSPQLAYLQEQGETELDFLIEEVPQNNPCVKATYDQWRL